MITYNNIVNRFQTFVDNHEFLKSFSHGSPADVDLDKFELYPLLHLVYTGGTYDTNQKTYNLEIYILDSPPSEESKTDNQKEAISDAEQVAEDILADIENGGNIFTFGHYYDLASATTTPLEEETSNVLSGVLLDISVTVAYEYDACNAPISGVTPEGTGTSYARRGVLKIIEQDGTPSVTTVQTIKVSNGTLTDEGNGVVSIDTGGGGGAVSSVNGATGVVVLSTSDIAEGTNEYYTDAKVSSNSAVTANTTKVGYTDSAVDLRIGLANMDDLSDVAISTPALNEVLKFNGSSWVNGTSTSGGASAMNDLTDVDTTGLAVGDCLVWDGTNWVAGYPTHKGQDSSITYLAPAASYPITPIFATNVPIPITDNPVNFSFTNSVMRAGNAFGKRFGTDSFSFNAVGYGTMFQITGTLRITPSASSNLISINLIGTGQAPAEKLLGTFTSTTTDVVDFSIDSGIITIGSHDVDNQVGISLYGLTTSPVDVIILELNITFTNN